MRADLEEGIMFDFIFDRKNSVPRPSLYCIWIRAHEGENAPLIQVWIDPSMSVFESQAWVHEPDLRAAQAEAEAAPSLLDFMNAQGGLCCDARSGLRRPHTAAQLLFSAIVQP
jgi:hypothetical protein